MIRELVIYLYLTFFQITFNFFKLFPQKNKTVCVASFGDNIYYTVRALSSISDEEIIILKESSCKYPFDYTISTVIPFQVTKPFYYLKSIYHLATAKSVLVDNYFGFLAVTNFKAGTTCIQLWHAAGAIKRFGLQKTTIGKRSSRSFKRFLKVYNRFDYTIVGSDKMATIFKDSFSLSDEKILRTGIPRTDLFFNKDEKKEVLLNLTAMYPVIKNKNVILYAPTFRDNNLKGYQVNLDIKQLYEEFSKNYVLFVKFHPAVSYQLDTLYKDFVYDVSHYYDINHILLCTDILITDYSSIPFEFALLEKPMVFYAYDQIEYQLESGLIDNYDNVMPGPIVKTTKELINVIKSDCFKPVETKLFSKSWNLYSTGNSSLNLVKFLIKSKSNKETHN